MLQKGNEWYCGRCRKHVIAAKKMEVFAFPKILILHLKRFKENSALTGEKLNTLVSYPLDGLDLTKYEV